MKKIILLTLFLFAAYVGNSQEEYKAGNEGWLVKIDEAYALSKETGKPIMANFTGSDWCGWCKRLTASVFAKPAFKTWAAENVILLELDYPRRTTVPKEIREQNAALQQAFQVRGYPTVWVFNMDKDPETGKFEIEGIGKTGYKKTVDEFTASIDQMIKTSAANKAANTVKGN